MPGRPALLFDLDGTLTDPFVGITESIRHALIELGWPAPEPEALRWCIGPPLYETFPVLLETGDSALVARAVGLYRERYIDVGKFENSVIGGIPQVLDELGGRDLTLFVATSKPASYARDIVEHFGLMRHFRSLHGSAMDGTNSAKTDLLEHLLRSESIDPSRAVMVGDRRHDVEGARANGVRSIGVLWGYGDRDELEGAGADWIAEKPGDITNLVAAALGER